MSAFWPHWARLGWFFAWPLLAWLCWALWLRRRRSGRWQALLPSAFHATLLRGSQARAERWPRVLLGLAALLAGLALVGPGWQREQQIAQRPDDPLVIILALTPDMLAKDASPDRLGQARRKILDLLQHRADAQTAIVVYAGSAHTLVPLSDDEATSRNLLEALKPSLMPEPGQRADLAVHQALDLLAQAGQGPGRLLLIAPGLSDLEREGIDHWLGRHSPPLLVLGVGSAEGGPVTLENGELLKGPDGAIAVLRLDATALAATAARAHGRYESARLDNHDLRALGLLDTAHTPMAGDETPPRPLDRWADQGYWLLLPLLALAALAGRRGWLLCLPLLLGMAMAPRPVYAYGLADLWWRPDQQGAHLLTEGKPAQAAQRFIDYRWQGIAFYRAGRYAEAAQCFAEGDSAADHYNRGNALAQNGQLEAALQAYEQALEREPGLRAASDNRALVQKLLDAGKAEPNPANPAEGSANAAPASAQGGSAGEGAGGEQGTAAAAAAPPSATPPAVSAATASGNAGANAEGAPGAASPAKVASASEAPDDEARESLEQWLRQIPDDPSELLRRKFWYEQQQRQEQHP
ncbi:VWA domain-containing protein [Pseudomonas sp. RIT-PI-S]|uniref:vWA domain-containing protein n=1 Tax=Pseudomonas sp. RIT-PI-S TaxID=3035295 RepID=UPI0021DB6840|nr:VWA domain-containing protein [Pseudomonas sp. RIT-PI-S]